MNLVLSVYSITVNRAILNIFLDPNSNELGLLFRMGGKENKRIIHLFCFKCNKKQLQRLRIDNPYYFIIHFPTMDRLERQYRSNERHHHLKIADTGVPLKSNNQNIDIRKCLTPCLGKSKPKTKPSKPKYPDVPLMIPHNIKDRNKSSDRRDDSRSRRKTDSKLKNRPSSTMANARFSKQLENHHQNFNQSNARLDYKLDEDISMVRIKDISFKNLDHRYMSKELISLLNEGRRHLKNSNFHKAQDCFKQAIKYPDGNSVQVLYLLGICSFHLQNYHEAIKLLNSVLLKDDSYRKNVFFFLAISYKRIDDIQSAIQILTITITKASKNYQALLFRGKLLARQKKYLEAISDFNKCLSLQPTRIAPIVSKADALRGLMNLQQASQLYSQALAKYPEDTNILLKRGHCFLQLGKLQLSKSDLQQILRLQPTHSQAYYFKGVIFYKTRNFNDALLSFQQAIKHNSSKKATTKALYEIAKIKIQLRDFYGASYTLERADSLDVDRKVLEKIKLFLDGSTFLMKKKTKRGVELLSTLIKKQTIPQFIKSQTFSFRAYGYFSQYKYTHALNDLISLQKMGFYLDQASSYNKILLEGIIAVQNNRFQEALLKFGQSERMKPTTADPNIYKALTLISMYNRSSTNQKSKDILQEAVVACSYALGKQQGNWNCSFIRATLFYTLQKYQQALSDVQKAIDKSDDHVIKHFYLRAMIYAAMQKYKEALGDFSNVSTLMKELRQKSMQSRLEDSPQRQKQMPEAYLNRAKCYLLFGQKRRAFQDLQNYISYRPLDPEIHVMAGKLLFSIGASEDAIKAYGHCPNIESNPPILLQRAKCYLLLKQLNYCLKDMQKIVESGDNKMRFDFVCLDSLREASKNATQSIKSALKNIQTLSTNTQGGHIFHLSDFHFYQGVYLFYLKNYSEALKEFNKTMQIKVKTQTLEEIINVQEDLQQNYQNRIFTADQLKYNIGIANLMVGNREEATKILSKFKNFRRVIMSGEVPTFGQQNSISQSDEKQSDITPFPINNRLCSIFPAIVANGQEFRLSFCLPKVLPPQTELKVEEELIDKLNINCTQARPDAPWIRRNSFGVVFTQDLMGCDVDLQTEQEQSVRKNYRQQQEQQQSPASNWEQEKRRFKQSLMLDPTTKARLAKLMN